MNRGRQAAALVDDESDDEENARMLRQQQLRMVQDGGDPDDPNNGVDPEDNLGGLNDYADSKGPLAQWIQKPDVTLFIKDQFESFLKTFRDPSSGQNVYEDRIQSMCQRNRQSFELAFTDLSGKHPTLAIWLAEEPRHMLPIFD